MGRDQFGLWAEFTVPRRDADNVSQRLRWIPPGRFLMGSPESEKGRFGDEGPQHEAIVAAGFWLFDTPCTQGLWNAVMGNNPSQFKGDRRPVEQVSWHEAADFVSKLSAVAGLQLQLPTETQWEYACRAGSDAATYAGDFDPGDPATQQELQRIAWYGQNAGGKTHDVGELRPNPWGLYDMLGNVLEWCRDTWSVRYDKAREEDSSSAIRVFRGGCWGSSARYVRAAYRDGSHPGHRGGSLGFRCSSSGGEPG
ncbi:MAG TPA: Sulphatase-modifying factor protein [Planctomycetaceae bacterium]|nr:Sulphatase-modifying factor protein [Planctomycetaceae bacterium]